MSENLPRWSIPDEDLIRLCRQGMDMHEHDTPEYIVCDALLQRLEPPASSGEDGTLAYARNLAVSMHRNHYADVKQWRPLPDVLGLLTQIDNMTAGLVRAGPSSLPRGRE
jgi:hypothetical protein